MPNITIDQHTTSSQLRTFHREIAENSTVAEVALGYPDQYRSLGAVRYGALLQAVITWASQVEDARLILPESWLEQVGSGLIASDLHLTALVLANHVNGAARGSYGASVADCITRSLAHKGAITSADFDADEGAKSIVLASHSLNYRWSPDLHLLNKSVPEIEESARSLFHDIWRTSDDARTLRSPILQLDEVALPATDPEPTHVARTAWPKRHPNQGSSIPFSPLVARTVRPRGLAELVYARRLNRPEATLSGIGSVLFELIQNTQWHASGPGKTRSVEGCRVFRFGEERLTRGSLAGEEATHRGFAEYVAAVLEVPRENALGAASAVTLATINIVDHGIGLAASAAASRGESDLLSPSTEVNYLRMALAKGISVNQRSMSNIGLPRVQQLLSNLDGFMLIRTGSNEIYRDFKTNPFGVTKGSHGPVKNSQFIEWVPLGDDEFDVGPRVGTAVTIVIPVDYEVRA